MEERKKKIGMFCTFLCTKSSSKWKSALKTDADILPVAFHLGMLSTAASLGMLLLWDVDGGLTQIDKYLYSNEDYIKVCILRFGMTVHGQTIDQWATN